MNIRINGKPSTVKVSRSFFFAPFILLALSAYSNVAIVASAFLFATIVFGGSTPVWVPVGIVFSAMGARVLRRQLSKATTAYGKALLARTKAAAA